MRVVLVHVASSTGGGRSYSMRMYYYAQCMWSELFNSSNFSAPAKPSSRTALLLHSRQYIVVKTLEWISSHL